MFNILKHSFVNGRQDTKWIDLILTHQRRNSITEPTLAYSSDCRHVVHHLCGFRFRAPVGPRPDRRKKGLRGFKFPPPPHICLTYNSKTFSLIRPSIVHAPSNFQTFCRHCAGPKDRNYCAVYTSILYALLKAQQLVRLSIVGVSIFVQDSVILSIL